DARLVLPIEREGLLRPQLRVDDELEVHEGPILDGDRGVRAVDEGPHGAVRCAWGQPRRARRFSASVARNSSVVCHAWSGPTSSARSLVIAPLSTVVMTTSSRVEAKSMSAWLPSSTPRCCRPRVHA